ncbi:unnamed protein product [Ascophyllum nodosum]
MPPKKKQSKDKKKERESVPDRVDFTRRPLPSLEPCDANPTPRAERWIVSAQHAFEEWDEETLEAEAWSVPGDKPFKDDEGRSYLPSRLSKMAIGWARPSELIATGKTDGSNEDMDTKSGQGASPGTRRRGTVADKGRGKPKGKGKGPSPAPAPLRDAIVDADGKLLPRVLVPIVEATYSEAIDYGSRAAVKSLPRGFRQGWSQEQLGMIASYCSNIGEQRRNSQEQPEAPPGDTGGNANKTPLKGFVEDPGMKIGVSEAMPREHLTQEALEKLGAPAGGDVDPDMTAVFKAVAQLSSTCSATGCPYLWEAIHPQTAEKVPCYNPSGRYLLKLFAAGRWRKVEVDDDIPLDATRSPVMAASENPAELWPSLLSKALYKLYRLGGYGLARDATVGAVDSKSDDCRDDRTGYQVDRARFMAFVLHSLTGWIPSIIADRVPSVEEVSVEGTPCLSREDLRLPGLPPVDEEEEAARERLEDMKRRQALFLHKKRKPKKIKRKVVSAKERFEINSARFKNMRGITSKLHHGERRVVYLVCIPGEPLYPILATCPLEESSLEAFPVTVGHKPPECQDNVVKASTADEDIAVGRSSTNTRGKILSHTPGGSIPVAAAPATEEPLPEAGFLLRWDVPARDRWSSTRDEVDLRIDEASDEPHYGGFEGFDDTVGLEVEPANGAASLASPAFRWLTPHEIEQAGGIVVRAVTRVGRGFYADVPYHWSVPTAAVTDNMRASTATKRGNDRNAAKSSAKSKGGKGSKRTSNAGGGTDASLPSGEDSSPEVERPSSPPPPSAVAEGPKGTWARDPGCPPAIFLLIKPSPAPETTQSLPLGEEGDTIQDTPPNEGKYASVIPSEICAGSQDTARQQGSAQATTTTSTTAMIEGRAAASQRGSDRGGNGDPATTTPTGGSDLKSAKHLQESTEMLEDKEDAASDRGAKQGLPTEGMEIETREDEEGDIIMCLWADQPGGGTEATQDGYALAVLPEVLHGVSVGPRVSPAPVVAPGEILLRGRHKPELDGLPLTVASAKIHLTKGGVPKVYRVVLQPGFGCCVGFCCTHAIQTGDAGQIWKAMRHSIVTETGNYPASRPGEWRIVFRRAFRVGNRQGQDRHINNTPDAQADTTVPSADVHSDGPATAASIPLALDSHEADAACGPPNYEQNRGPPSRVATFVKAILHISDEAAHPSVRLAFVDEDDGTEMFQPLLHTHATPLYPNIKGYTVLATVCSRTKPLAEGNWRLQLLSDSPLLSLDDPGDKRDGGGSGKASHPGFTSARDEGKEPGPTIVACQERTIYGGVYVPNKYLLLFRDVLTCASPLPFAARLRTSLPGVGLCLAFLDAATGEVLCERRGSQLLQVLSVTLPQAPADSNQETLSPKKAAKQRKGPVGAAAEESTATPLGNIIIEAAIDREIMQVPANFVSELPYYYQPTPAALDHYVPPCPRVSSRVMMQSPGYYTDATESGSTIHVTSDERSSKQLSVSAEEGFGGPLRDGKDSSATQSTTALAEATMAEEAAMTLQGNANASTEKIEQEMECSASLPKEKDDQLQWWLEIVGAGKVEMMHDTSRFDSENREVERWEAAEPGRASRAAILWTQHQAANVASLGGEILTSQPTAKAAVQGSEVNEEWIKARAAALGVPVELEKERQASRATLQDYPQMAQAPRGSASSAPESPAIRTAATELGPEELQAREKERSEFKAKAKNFELDWEAERVKKVEAGKEQIAMQLAFIRGQAQCINAGRERFLRDRERIVQDMIAKAEARKVKIAMEQEAFETAAKVKDKKKPKKGKAGKK